MLELRSSLTIATDWQQKTVKYSDRQNRVIVKN